MSEETQKLREEFEEFKSKFESKITYVRGFIYGFTAFISLILLLGLISKGELIRSFHSYLFPQESIFAKNGKLSIAHSVSFSLYHSDDINTSRTLLPVFLEENQRIEVKFEFIHTIQEKNEQGLVNVFVGSTQIFEDPIDNWPRRVDLTDRFDPIDKPLENIMFQLDEEKITLDKIYVRGIIRIYDSI